MKLQVQLPMILWMDNSGANDLFNSWTVSGWLRHAAVQINFMRKLKEQGLMEVRWFESSANSSDLYTKNLGGALFQKHMERQCGPMTK